MTKNQIIGTTLIGSMSILGVIMAVGTHNYSNLAFPVAGLIAIGSYLYVTHKEKKAWKKWEASIHDVNKEEL